jgi:capsule polysaccharide export protein KpsE/RkpR
MAAPEDAWWQMLGTLFHRRWFIIIVTTLVAIASIVISLILPVSYKASSRLLLPEESSGGLSAALLGDLGSAAASLLGGGGGDYVRYLAILNSRTVKNRIVDEFDLISVYDLQESATARMDARDQLADNVDFAIDDEFNFLSIEVLDRDPERAAAIANYYVDVLDEVNNRLKSQTAGNFRIYVEKRYLEAAEQRGELLDSLAAFQRRYGVYDLEAQTQAFFEQIADLRAEALQAEIQYEALKNQFGDQNPTVQNLEAVVDAAEAKYRAALAGSEAVLPVSREDAPDMIRRYAELMMGRTIQERILELVAPMLEQARFEEQRQTEALQVMDVAVPPELKARPIRSLIVIGATLSGFILAVVYVLLIGWWKRNHREFGERLRQESLRAREAG